MKKYVDKSSGMYINKITKSIQHSHYLTSKPFSGGESDSGPLKRHDLKQKQKIHMISA